MKSKIAANSEYIFRVEGQVAKVYDINDTYIGDIDTSPGIVTCIACNDNYLFIGTSNAGVSRILMSNFSTGTYNTAIEPYANDSLDATKSNNVTYMSCSDNYLAVITDLYIEQHNLTTEAVVECRDADISVCNQTDSGKLYYSIDNSLFVVYNNTNNWTSETAGHVYSYDVGSYSYTNEGKIFSSNLPIKDIDVAEGMSSFSVDDNVIAVVFDDNVVIIDERMGNEEECRYKWFLSK